MIGKRTLLMVGIGLVGLNLAVAPAQATLTYDHSFGGLGNGAGQLSDVRYVAVNHATGDVYVTDAGNQRVQQFDAEGNFIRMWGSGVDQDTTGNVCTAASGHACGPGEESPASGGFFNPSGIAVDNSGGSAQGSVYVVDRGNNRVERFSAAGDFVLMWGRNVDHDTGADLCTAASGDTCQAGRTSGDPSTTPPTPSVVGEFAGANEGVAVDGQGFVYVADGNAVPYSRVQKFDSDGNFVAQIAAENKSLNQHGLDGAGDIAVDAAGNLYSIQPGIVKRFDAADFTPDGTTAAYDVTYGRSLQSLYGPRAIAVDPSNQFLLDVDNNNVSCQDSGQAGFPPGLAGAHVFEFHPQGQPVDCTVPTSPPLGAGGQSDIGGAAMSLDHRLYVSDLAAHAIRVYHVPVSAPPVISTQSATAITSNSSRIDAQVVGNLSNTTVHVEYGIAPCSNLPDPCTSTPESDSIGASTLPQPASRQVNDLQPDTTYYYRVVATNGESQVKGPDRKFTTFAVPSFQECPNNLARQQTGAAFLFDCRAYELVSASDQGGYDVESNLVAGQTPFGGYPQADGPNALANGTGKALYAVHNGGVPGAGKPTNRGPDPYVAVRDAANKRWDTTYVGIPADVGSNAPFSSTLAGADASLSAFAFAGPEICAPCFPDGSSGIPLRLPDGSLVQGMAGSLSVLDPVPAGEVKKPLSPDGSHFVFGSTQRFEPAGNTSGTDVTIYDHDLKAHTTQVVSTLPDGSTIVAGQDVAELDASTNGSRVLIGVKVGTDAAGNSLYHLYMHVGADSHSIDLTPGATGGVLYDGMSADGTTVYFTARDALSTAADQDTDASADIYRADVGSSSATLTRVSAVPGAPSGGPGDTDSCDPAGNSFNADWNAGPGDPSDCSAVAVGGGAGVASDSGAVYFLSPEQLDGSAGQQNAPNLYLARPGQAPHFVATLESGASAPLRPKAHLFQRSFGSFTNPTGVAIDPVTGSSYVLDVAKTFINAGAFVQKFDSSGKIDIAFGANGKVDGTDTLKGPFVDLGAFDIPGQIAVDSYPGTVGSPNFSYRDLYVPDYANVVVDKFNPSGESVNALLLPKPPTGVAVNPANGNLYVSVDGNSGSNIYVYTPNGTPVTNFNVTGSPRGVAVDSSGNVYVVSGSTDNSGVFTGDTREYNSSGTFVKVLDPNPSYGVAVDPSDNHVYVDEGDKVVEFDPSGAQVGDPIGSGAVSDSIGLAAASGRLVISNYGGGNVVSYGPPAVPPDPSYDSPLVLHSVADAQTRHSADFQTTPSGDDAVFTSTLPLGTGFDSAGHAEVFRYDANSGDTDCASCNPTDTPPSSDAGLASNGSSLTDDGRVFFTSAEPLVLRDTNSKKDAYEWEQGDGPGSGRAELISTGSGGFDSGLLSVTADGTDAFFFTRDTLDSGDHNGTLMKLYDARENGGFFDIPPQPQCAASDECHGPGSQVPSAPSIRTNAPGTGGNCRQGFVRKGGGGKCEKRRHRKHRKKRHRTAAKSRRGGRGR